ncbi:helix-turn-helix domain-containing protein [Kocuria sediminis]|uniref:Helix-turn-helix domain-containing protein n=1 Tax=Kocuria sediminis TaxID=1038857 RepID=A0A6N8GH60_9MICC|nr:helix-turn-helix transcriptional regulator [Kocuria sediminis]MUN61587.1 helix-turn-helix domain-containing protein [Kocuria sediminis]
MSETTVSRSFRENLRRQREARNWTQGDLARYLRDTGATALGHQTTLARLESGQRAVRLDEAVTIARVLDITLDKLLVTPEAVAALDQAADLAHDMEGAHRNISEAVTTFLAAREGVAQGRAGVVHYAEAGVYEGPMAQHVEEMLALIDKALSLTVDDAVAHGTKQWELETGGGGDA